MLDDFVAYLVKDEHLTVNTARAYKSWVAKAMVERGAHESHVKSASGPSLVSKTGSEVAKE